jgi:heme exporter protein A
MDIPRLALDAITCERGARPLFAPLSFTVGAGEWVHLQGANGAGKTTLLRTLCGLMPPASGTIRWQGQTLAEAGAAFRSDLLYLGHALALKGELSALENLLIDARLRGHDLTPQAAQNALEALGLRTRAHLPLRVLSQGQQRRAALARLAVSRARLWVLDEPWVALDADSVQRLSERLDAHVQGGGSLVFTSHQAAPLQSPGHGVRLGA